MIEKIIAKKIREFRKAKGLDQKTLAQRSGLNRSYISLLENGKKTAAVSSLSRIANALGVRLGEFFEEADSFRTCKIVVTKGQLATPKTEKSDFGYTYTPLSREMGDKIMDPFLVRLDPKTYQKHVFEHIGEEFNYVLEGKLKITHGTEEYILEPGDSAYFVSSVPHKFEVMGDKAVYVLSINTTGIKSCAEIKS